MRQEIHPKYTEVTVTCSCGNTFVTKSTIGKNTVTAIQAGILIGYVGLVRHQLASIRSEVGEQYIAVATGGLSKILSELENDFEEVNMDLTIEGLRLIGEIDYVFSLKKEERKTWYILISGVQIL